MSVLLTGHLVAAGLLLRARTADARGALLDAVRGLHVGLEAAGLIHLEVVPDDLCITVAAFHVAGLLLGGGHSHQCEHSDLMEKPESVRRQPSTTNSPNDLLLYSVSPAWALNEIYL